ncbi:COQ9 family protein [Phenylobacterium sp.]|uniref:COQ9 family protein n=1 Tax=Phenylobacterium sp. TaxID=1871053 RepID=UPI002F94CEB3
MSDTKADWASEAEQQLLEQALRIAPREGWTWRMARQAGRALGFSDGETELLIPRGPADLAALLSRRHDQRAMVLLKDVDPAALKIRERIRRAVEARIDVAAADEPATRRWAGWLALPQNLHLGGKLAWESADVLWRWAGDTATDENHYTKRAILGGILTGALAMRIANNRADAMAFVDRQIQHVMDFEKWKATTSFRPERWVAGIAQALGKARYGKAGPAADVGDAP